MRACWCSSRVPRITRPSSPRVDGTGAPRGTGGFGYDPHFEDLASGLTGAELPLERKNALSHRGKAMRELLTKLVERELVPEEIER